MVLTVQQILDQYAWLYTDLPVPAGTWDHVLPVDGAYTAIKRVGGIDYVMFRGSTTFLDWIEDFAHFALPYDDPALGGVHAGFVMGVRAVKNKVDALVGKNVIVVGHSLGAGHAALYAGFRIADAKPVDHLIMFGEPKAGGPKLRNLLTKTWSASYRTCDKDGHDLVTDVPFSAPPLLNYVHPKPLIDVQASPLPDDPWGPFRYHHLKRYGVAFNCTGPAMNSLKG